VLATRRRPLLARPLRTALIISGSLSLVVPLTAGGVAPVNAKPGHPRAPRKAARAGSATRNASLPAARSDSAGLHGLDPRVFALALDAVQCATTNGSIGRLWGAATQNWRGGLGETLTVIDYSRPSTEPRLWVFEMPSQRLVYRELVAHGRGSGDNLAVRFSNTPESHQTSLGLFVTGATYTGRNGYSLRLHGLEPGVNDRAEERAIVIHGAPYVNAQIGTTLGRLGRSFGCPAVRDAIARPLIDTIKDGGFVFSYYPSSDWLAKSPFLGKCMPSVVAN
jgi:hypothetical protein